jgi:hypothetical protein
MHEKAEKPWFFVQNFREFKKRDKVGRFLPSGFLAKTGFPGLVLAALWPGAQKLYFRVKKPSFSSRRAILKKDHAEKGHFRAEINLSDPEKTPNF